MVRDDDRAHYSRCLLANRSVYRYDSGLKLVFRFAEVDSPCSTGLDDLSTSMKRDGLYGQAILFGLILLTTFRAYCASYSLGQPN